jgi:hypothetical protein
MDKVRKPSNSVNNGLPNNNGFSFQGNAVKVIFVYALSLQRFLKSVERRQASRCPSCVRALLLFETVPANRAPDVGVDVGAGKPCDVSEVQIKETA